MFTEKDIQQINEKGLTIAQVEQQIENFREGFPYLKIRKPAKLNDGIKKPDEKDIEKYISNYEKSLKKEKVLKFVPASGAASRMFRQLFHFMETYKGTQEEYLDMLTNRCFNSNYYLYEKIENFAFINDLKEAIKNSGAIYEDIINKRDYICLLQYLLTEKGLNYGNLPKGLLKFHKYGMETERTPVEEHLVEGALYANSNGTVNIHFTISPEHKQLFEEHLKNIMECYEKKFNVKYHIKLSTQDSSTDIIAVNMENEPFRIKEETLLFRPGGHGALLKNLNKLDADIIFIKNIDNVVHERINKPTIKYKKILGGILLAFRKKIHEYIECLNHPENVKKQNLTRITNFMRKELNFIPPKDYEEKSTKEKITYLKERLNRPIRVCGMVRNEGEPGGGPFWVENNEGETTLQIVEMSQINMNDPEKKAIVHEATYFNPVDIVCSIKDYKGKKFDLFKYRDMNTGIISKKSKDGENLKAQELPGLWNGGMADWNTIFVEVPIETFNPVKTINDLLRKEHQLK